jgi:hypothetical protein
MTLSYMSVYIWDITEHNSRQPTYQMKNFNSITFRETIFFMWTGYLSGRLYATCPKATIAVLKCSEFGFKFSFILWNEKHITLSMSDKIHNHLRPECSPQKTATKLCCDMKSCSNLKSCFTVIHFNINLWHVEMECKYTSVSKKLKK